MRLHGSWEFANTTPDVGKLANGPALSSKPRWQDEHHDKMVEAGFRWADISCP